MLKADIATQQLQSILFANCGCKPHAYILGAARRVPYASACDALAPPSLAPARRLCPHMQLRGSAARARRTNARVPLVPPSQAPARLCLHLALSGARVALTRPSR